ncbi:MAG: signal recognition particle protein [Puniceicoccales bacterium]|jgi:signal recognition particle subunit SRP54|nr:signal recognition particle protein [Puniceicoccales bacterium]
MFESITDKISRIFKNLRGLGKLSERNISEVLGEIRSALLSADVNFFVVNHFIQRVKTQCLGQTVIQNVTPEQQFVKIIFDEIARLLGNDHTPELSTHRPLKILMIGLHGSGKTTSTAKLAYFLKNKAKFSRPLAIGCDIYRPAAMDQLEVLSRQASIDCYIDRNINNAVDIAYAGLQYAEKNRHDLVIFDSAGRLQIDECLIEEIKDIKTKVQPDEVFLVADGALGQEAANIAKQFHEAVALTGIILTKLDGDMRAGAALSMKEVTGVPIRYMGTGEKIELLEIFHPSRIAQRILGMGDVVSLVEKAQEQVTEKEAKALEKKLKKGKFDLHDFLQQLQSIKKMGSIESLIQHLPGMHHLNASPEANHRIQRSEAIISSMTLKERSHPEIIDGSRRLRIAKGCGLPIQEVNTLLKNFKQMQVAMKKMKHSSFNPSTLLGR